MASVLLTRLACQGVSHRDRVVWRRFSCVVRGGHSAEQGAVTASSWRQMPVDSFDGWRRRLRRAPPAPSWMHLPEHLQDRTFKISCGVLSSASGEPERAGRALARRRSFLANPVAGLTGVDRLGERRSTGVALAERDCHRPRRLAGTRGGAGSCRRSTWLPAA